MSDRAERLAILALLVLAAALRLAGLGRAELWHDEAGSVLMTLWPGGIWAAAADATGSPDGGNPPLYYALLKAWTAVFGLSVPAVRSLSAVLGVALVGAVLRFARSLALPAPAGLVAGALAATGTLPVFYGTEARAYALLLVLLAIAGAAWADALRTGRRTPWVVHGAAVALAAWTHNLALPAAAAFWLATAARGASRRDWLGLAGAHGGAALLYLPWIGVLARQIGGEAHDWIRLYWDRSPKALLPLRSLELFAVGGRPPDYLARPQPPGWVRGLALATIAAAGAGLLRRPDGPPRGTRAALLALLAFPLAFLLVWSLAVRPLYLPGRYDLAAWPAFALLFGLGLDGLRRALPATARRVAPLALVALGALLAFHAHRDLVTHPRLLPLPGPDARIESILARDAGPADLLVCTGFTTNRVWLDAKRAGLGAEVATYPADLRAHLGWNDPVADLARGRDALRADAAALLARLAPAGDAPRLWLFFHPEAAPGTAYGDVLDAFFAQAEASGARLAIPPGEEQAWRRLGVVAFEGAR